jgi:serine O-acetyltransferase
MLDYTNADIECVLRQEEGFRRKLGQFLFTPGLHAVLLYRLSRWLHLRGLDFLAVPIGYFSSILTGAQISHRAIIGRGLVVYHPSGVVIGADAVIGNHCYLTGGNVIGQLRGQGDRPVIGDYFYGGNGAKILGKIQIGDRVRVGANSVVIRSFPDDSTVMGVPARIVFRRGRHALAKLQEPPSRDEIAHRLAIVLKECLSLADPLDGIDEGTILIGNEMGVDSVEMLRLVCAMEEEFQIDVDESEETFSYFRSVGSLVTFIERRMGDERQSSGVERVRRRLEAART